MTGEHVLAARVDERLRHDAPDREAERARQLQRLDTVRELATDDELAEILEAADAVFARRR